MYDTIIVGAGPAGLTLAWRLGRQGKKVLLIEREESIGGCHMVRRVSGYFTEHGPRIYLSNYYNFKQILNELGTDFYQLFTSYDFQMTNVGGQSVSKLPFWDLAKIVIGYLRFVISKKWSRKMTMAEFIQRNGLSDVSRDYLDRLCRMTDGAGIDRYTVYEFFQLLNQNVPYGIYQPRQPNDRGFLKIWQEKLEAIGVDIILGTSVVRLKIAEKNPNQNHVSGIETIDKAGRNLEFRLRNAKIGQVILAIPPMGIKTILANSGLNNSRWNQFAVATNYFTYIPITYHWHQKLKLPKVWGFPASDWGVVFIVLSDYMSFEQSKTVITTAITLPDAISKRTGKTANQSSEKELLVEVFRQLRLSFPDLPSPDIQLLSPEMYRDRDSSEWKTVNNAFVLTTQGYIEYDFRNLGIENLFNVGTHNGKSEYAFTAIESAITNALVFLGDAKFDDSQIITFNQMVGIGLVFLVVLIIFLFLYR